MAVPPGQAARSVQAAPPLTIRHLRPSRPHATAPTLATPRRFTYVARPRAVVKVSAARRLVTAHRSAVISKLAPTAPLVRARVLTAVSAPHASAKPVSSTAKTIAALGASLRKR